MCARSSVGVPSEFFRSSVGRIKQGIREGKENTILIKRTFLGNIGLSHQSGNYSGKEMEIEQNTDKKQNNHFEMKWLFLCCRDDKI